MGPRLIILATASIVLLAGCSGFGFPAAPSPTATPTHTPTTQYPPGLTAEGVSDPFALATAHASLLQNASYSVNHTSAVRYANGSLYTSENANTRVAANEDRYRYTAVVAGRAAHFLGGGNGTVNLFSNGSVVVRRYTTENRTSHNVVYTPNGEPAAPSSVYHGTPVNDERIAILFGQLSNTTVTRESESSYNIRGTSFANHSIEVNGIQISNVTAVEFTAAVRQDGLVQEYRLSLRGEVDGHTVRVVERVGYSAIESTRVTEPSWFAQALSNESAGSP